MATNSLDPKAQIPLSEMSDDERQELQRIQQSGMPDEVWTQAKRDAFNKKKEIFKEQEEENNSIFNTQSDKFLKFIDVKEDDNILVKAAAYIANGGPIGIGARKLLGDAESSEEDKEFQKLKDEELKEKVRINHQAYLLFNHQQLTKESRDAANRFTQFAQIEHDYPAEINNLIFKKPIKYDILLNSKSAQLSYLVPKIRLFKQYKISKDQVVNVEMPITQPYQDESFESILTNKEGRGGGVGIKSFKWSSIGTGLGNQYSFGAELELFFESIGEISKIRSFNKVGDRIIPTSFEDLLIARKEKEQKPEGAVYDPDYFRLKAEVGWSVPYKADDLIPADMIDEIKSSTLSLYLTLHSHEIDIADDSTVTLKIKYTAYIEALTDSPKNSNVFYSDKKHDETIKSKREEIEREAKKLKGSEETGDPPLEGLKKKQTEEFIEKTEKEIEEEQNKGRLEAYSRILGYIYNTGNVRYMFGDYQSFQKFTRLLSIPKSYMRSEKQIQEFNKEMESLRSKNSKIGKLSGWPTQPDLGGPDSEKMTENVTKATESFNSAGITGAQNAMLLNGVDKEQIKDKIIIPFFYLGDLLESVLSAMYNGDYISANFYKKEIKLLLGPIIFYDYGRLTDKISLKPGSETKILPDGTKTKGSVYTGEKTVINIADIPISLDTFTAWFTKKIVDAGVSNMSFRDFINLILNDLVIRSVGVETYSFAPRQKTRLVYKTKTIRRKKSIFFNNLDTSDSTKKSTSMSEATSSEEIKHPDILRFPASSITLFDDQTVVEEKVTIDNYMLIYAVSDQQFELKSDYESDKKRGIRHIVYGAETGLIKNIKFLRQDNPLIRTHNMRIASQQNSDKSIILREVYNANIEMFGNNLFEIGELIYVSPSLFGSNTSLSFVKNLGIGGYFMILKVNNTIQDGSFLTNLELRWNAKGDGVPLNVQDGLQKEGEVKLI